ncbi:MAG TPA: DUF1800 domain-containing protein [Gemmatimonadaceae bacterium]|jgi:uncharacterized protein (DUF1800 family)
MVRLRQLVLVAVGVATMDACGSPATNPRTTASPMSASSPAFKQSDLSARERARHALNRLAFGPRPGDVEAVASMGVDKWIARQLDAESIPEHGVGLLTSLQSQTRTTADLVADYPTQAEVNMLLRPKGANNQILTPPPGVDSALLRRVQTRQNQINAQVYPAKMIRAISSDRQLLEVMTNFWENHFSVYSGKAIPYALDQYDREVIRPHALGKFRDLLSAVARSPEMMFYLDNWDSAVDTLHANADERIRVMRRLASPDSDARAFARLPHRRFVANGLNENYARELMELHTLGVDGGYSQQDVIAVARAFTGWSIDTPALGAKFLYRPEWHDADAKVILGHALAPGRQMEDGEEVLRILAASPATARFITTKLARHFIADDPPASVVDRCSKAYLSSDGDIRETMRCIVTGPEFFSRAAYGAKVKTPFELVASTIRAVGGVGDTTQRLPQQAARLGQPIFGRSTPDGWPDRGEDWLNSGAVLNRINFALAVASGAIPGSRPADWPFAAALRTASRDQQVRAVAHDLLGDDVSPETIQALESGSVKTPTSGANLTGLPAVVGLALGSPEFQHR